MARIASTLLVLLLLVGTAAAFAVTERLKLEPSPITGTLVDRLFSPLVNEASIAFDLREADRMTLSIVDGSDRVVRTLVDRRRVPAGPVDAAWDGRDDAGEVVPEGTYHPQVRLADAHRTIVLPNPIRVDTTPPTIELVAVAPTRISPGIGDVNNKVNVDYVVDEPANALLYVDGEQRVFRRGRPLEGRIEWFGRVEGVRVPAGAYRLELAAQDAAGNRSARVPAGVLEVRYISLRRHEIRVRARTRFGVRVETDAERFSWRFAGATGTATPGVLVLRAPRAGRYRLFVDVDGRADVATVIVEPRPGP